MMMMIKRLEIKQKEMEDKRLEQQRLFEIDQKAKEAERKVKEDERLEKMMLFEIEQKAKEDERLEKLRIFDREQEARVAEGRGKQSDGNEAEVPVGKGVDKVPKMPYFDEERDFMGSYLGRFQRFAETQKWKREHWAMYLSALLKGRALDVYSRMPPEQTSRAAR